MSAPQLVKAITNLLLRLIKLKLYFSHLHHLSGSREQSRGIPGGARPQTSCDDVSTVAKCTSCLVHSRSLEEGGDLRMNERKPQIVKDRDRPSLAKFSF